MSLDDVVEEVVLHAGKKIADTSIEGASAFLSRICLPVAEEFGLYMKDKVSGWRIKNAVKIANKAGILLEAQIGIFKVHAHPKIVHEIIKHGSWSDDDSIQNMWAGFLVTACNEDGKDESNLIFINLLKQLTSNQVKLLNYICSNINTFQSNAGWISAMPVSMRIDQLQTIMNTKNIYQIDRELDHLRTLGLITNGFSPNSLLADVTPTYLCLDLYRRSKGSNEDPNIFFKSVTKTDTEISEIMTDFNKNF